MELYMVCVMMAIALAVVIIKGIQCVLSLIHPMPSEADIRWRQNPRLPLEQHKKQIKMAHKNNSKSTINNGAKEMNKIKEPKEKRLPRNIRLERLYAGSPASFDEFIDTSFSRRSDFDSSYNRSPPPRSVDDYVVRLDHHHHHPQSQNQTLLEQLSFAEDVDDDDPIESYVMQQHRKILESSQNRASTPIQQQQHSSSTTKSPPYSKSHATIV
ncbi:uncharacterized protein LOC113792568 [Dermatophagoides pteronyssinus]|uniref:Uncharacterized protein LOC113792568 n=1 Tax=Dermatophagoides pteronyssinus TaxID=6956 RepID=A0A6P6Y1T6_DERPT|nr:uncharacterized protein LOC113792568 [Dermatophagoides pteronyssinus]